MGDRANPTAKQSNDVGFVSWPWAPIWVGLLALAVALRAYHVTGFLPNYDEAHWLIYSLDKRLLFQSLQSSRPRPDLLFPLILSLPIKLLGPNELALRLFPMLMGSLSVFPLATLVFRLTGRRDVAFCGAAFLAVLPLHVYFSAQGIPDTIALFFGLCGLARLARAGKSKGSADFLWMTIWLAMALLTKAIAIYCWVFLVATGPLFFQDRRQLRAFYVALGFSALPLASFALMILLRGQPMAFLHEPGVTASFGPSLSRQWLHLQSFVGFYEILVPVAMIGAALTVLRAAKGSSPDRQLLVWLFPVANLVVTPFFRAGRTELLWLIPTVCLFAALAAGSLRQEVARWLAAGITLILLAGCLLGVPLPNPGPALPESDYTSGVLRRPVGWPSRDATRWLVKHTAPEDEILFTAFTFTDPLLLGLDRVRHVIPNAGANWTLLRDPENRIKYVVFTHNYRGYAPLLASYADAHFTLPVQAQFPGYAIYDCEKEGQVVAYPDAYNSASQYVQRGMKLLEQHRLEQAVEAFEEALEVDPNQPVANANLALLYYQLGRQAEAITQCERNIRLGANPAIGYGVLGQIREQQGNFTAAQAAYEESLKSDPNNPVTLQLLANLKARLPAAPSSSGPQ